MQSDLHLRGRTTPGTRLFRLLAWIAIVSGFALFWAPAKQTFASNESPHNDTDNNIVINEVHYKPEPVTEWVEFVEIHNAGNTPTDLSGWLLDGGIRYLFPAGSVLTPNAYLVIAQDAPAYTAKFGQAPAGQFHGKLKNDHEQIVLRDNNAAIVDEIAYGFGFPWPTVGMPPGNSIQLINASLDNTQPGAWRSALPSPGAPNLVKDDNAPPLIDQVSHSPQEPTSNDDVTISVRVNDSDGVASIALLYQIVAPGAYVAQHDPAYASDWIWMAMSQSENGQWQTVLPASMQQHRHLVRYRIHVSDGAGQQLIVPYLDDPQPNFAYFVYDGMPTWTASYNGQSGNQLTFDFNQMRPLPVYHFIAKQTDIADALFMPPSQKSVGYAGNDYPWRGTLVYGGTVYDHVTFRARGGTSRYGAGKNMWKINFHPGHRLQAFDDFGRPYDTQWDKLNLSAAIQQTHRRRRGEHGMFESISFRLFNLAGVEAPLTHYVQLRVIDDSLESSPSQYESDFWGLYLAIEQMDGRFLTEHDLPDGNLYKMEDGNAEKNNQGTFADPTHNDILGFLGSYSTTPQDSAWWRANLDLGRYYSYRAIVEAIHHYDIDQGKNYFYFLNPFTKKWSVHPWDLDATWTEKMPGSGDEPFLKPVLDRPEFQIEYQNRMREVRDLLFNVEQMTIMLSERANIIDSAANGLSMVDADRHLWDYNPIFGTRYVDPKRTHPGEFYRAAENGSFSGMVGLMRQWVVEREVWIDTTILTDKQQPLTPTVGYGGPPGFPADQLQFYASDFQDPQGPGTFAAIKWRVAEVTNPGGAVYDPAAPWIYEIDPVVESDVLTGPPSPWTIPNGSLKPLHTYRVRVRMQDSSGRWSHWSPALQFIAGMPVDPPPTNLVLTEIMYHPAPIGPQDGDDFEFVELTNTGPDTIDLSNFHFTQGIEYQFPPGSTLDAGERLVLAVDRDAFAAIHDVTIFDEYNKHLGNGGERLTLVDAYGRAIVSLEYDDEPPWPEEADGAGHSLVLDDETIDDQNPSNWRISTVPNGSPGGRDPQPILVNELLSNPGDGKRDEVELYNPTGKPADIGHWLLSGEPLLPIAYQLAAGTIIPPGEYLVLGPEHFEPAPGRSPNPDFDANGGQIYLSSASIDGQLTGYRHGFDYGASEQGMTLGRLTTTDGREHFVQQQYPSLGDANPGPIVGPIVISEINYRPTIGDEYIELTNNSDQPVKLYDPRNPQRTWRINGIFYDFPPGIEIPAGGSLLVVPDSPTKVCLDRSLAGNAVTTVPSLKDPATNATLPDETQVVGPYPIRLANGVQSLSLLKPITTTGIEVHVGDSVEDNAYLAVDQVDYDDEWPWHAMAAGNGSALRRIDLNGFGNEPTNWQNMIVADTVFSADALSPYAGLCTFEAFSTSDGREDGDENVDVEIHWVSHTESNVATYRLWRSESGQRADAKQINEEAIAAQGADGASAHYQFVDSSGQGQSRSTYWLEAVSESGLVSEVAFTRTRQPIFHVFMPMVEQY